jgi:hypothetical protein
MKERPILFSGPMVRAILAGRKTQTRRIVKPGIVRYDNGDWPWGAEKALNPGGLCPYGNPGDRLWVRETFAIECSVDGIDQPLPHDDGRPHRRHHHEHGESWWQQPHYRATDPAPELCITDKDGYEVPGVQWKPSIHMPRWASRITLRVTSVRVERLQAITGYDVVAEGVRAERCPCERCGQTSEMCPGTELDHVCAFAKLWESINGARAPWQSNPWVFVIGFEREVPA